MKKEFYKLIKDILTNPDGQSYSSKRVAGFICLFATIMYTFYRQPPVSEALFTLAGLTSVFFGLTTVDYKSMITNKVATGDTDPAKA